MENQTLENFTIYRDGEVSRWETYRPRLQAQLRLFRSNLGRGLRDFGNVIDQACAQSTLNPKM